MADAIDTTPAPVVHLDDILERQEILFPARKVSLPRALAYSNEADFDPVVAAGLSNGTYATRVITAPPVLIGRLPSGTVLRDRQFLLSIGNSAVGQSYSADPTPAKRHAPQLLADAVADNRPIADLGAECLLLARRGHNTWGHWGADTLAMAASVEAQHRGRFRYAIPQAGDLNFFTAMIQSLAFYGIGLNRLIFLPPHQDYRLRQAWVVTPIWRDSSPHPDALTALRAVPVANKIRPTKIAIMRRDHPHRNIANADKIAAALARHGFHVADLAGMPFAEQVSLFHHARIVFSVLGSGLTGLVHSPDGVSVVAASPSGWTDRYFYALAQHRSGGWADVKGRSMWNASGLLRDAPFEVPVVALEAALATS